MAYGLTQTVFKSKNVQQPAQQAKQAVQDKVSDNDKGGNGSKPESPLLAPVRPVLYGCRCMVAAPLTPV